MPELNITNFFPSPYPFSAGKSTIATTEKFLRVFGLRSLSELPETEVMLPPNDAAPMVDENADQVTIDEGQENS